MSGDKRSVSTDALETLGTIIGEGAGRDAIHVAVEPVQAGQLLGAGDHVRIVDGRAQLVNVGEGIGIVDPFLDVSVWPGERFWMLLYPRTITSLRHVWSHPAFDDAPEPVAPEPVAPDKAASEAWLEDFCSNYGLSYEHLLEAAYNYDDGDDYLTIIGEDASGEIPNGVWHHLGIVTGKKFKTCPTYFSCSC